MQVFSDNITYWALLVRLMFIEIFKNIYKLIKVKYIIKN